MRCFEASCRGFHHDAESLAFRRGSGAIEVWRTADALYISKTIHLRASRCPHLVGIGSIFSWYPSARNAFVDCEGEHLREVGFDEPSRPIDHVVKKTIRALVLEATVDDVSRKRRQRITVPLAVARQTANDAR